MTEQQQLPIEPFQEYDGWQKDFYRRLLKFEELLHPDEISENGYIALYNIFSDVQREAREKALKEVSAMCQIEAMAAEKIDDYGGYDMARHIRKVIKKWLAR